MAPSRSHLALGLLVAASLIPFYLFTFNGTFRVDDEHILAARAQSLALWGRLDAPQVSGNTRVQSLQPMGDQATQVEPLQSILGAGLYRLGTYIGMGGGQATLSLNLYLTALTGFVIFLTIRRLGFSDQTAGLGALLFGLGGMAWPYAGTFIRDTLAMSMGAVALLGWVRVVQPASGESGLATAVLLGTGLLGGILAKNTMVTLLICLVVSGLILSGFIRANGQSPRPRVKWFVVAAVAIALLVAFIPGRGALARFSLEYYGSLTGHFWSQLTHGGLISAAGPFFSPARSLFLFSPPLLLLAGLPWCRARVQLPVALPVALFVIGLAAAQALFYAAAWAGTFGWGLRFMLPALPALALVTAPVIEGALAARRSWGRRLVFGSLVLGSVIQLAGSLVPWGTAFAAWKAQGLDPYTTAAAWRAQFWVVPAQLAALGHMQLWDAAWLRLVRTGHTMALAIPLICTLLLALLVWCLRRGARHRVWTGMLVGLAIVAPVATSRLFLQADPGWYDDAPAFAAWQDWTADNLGPSDSVVVDGYASPLWTYMMNRWVQPVPWFSLTYRDPNALSLGPRNPADQAIVSAASGTGGSVWLAASLPRLANELGPPAIASALGEPALVFEGRPAVAVWRLAQPAQ